MELTPQTFSIHQGADEPITIKMSPPQSVDGWNFEFRAKSAAVNPDTLTATMLYSAIGSADTVIDVVDAGSFPLEGAFKVRIDNEILLVDVGGGFWNNGILSTRWTVERGIHGTTPATHASRARVSFFEQPQLLMDNASQGGVVVQDANRGVIDLRFTASATGQRPAGTYFWSLRRTDPGNTRTVAHGLLYLLPEPLSSFVYPLVHGIY